MTGSVLIFDPKPSAQPRSAAMTWRCSLHTTWTRPAVESLGCWGCLFPGFRLGFGLRTLHRKGLGRQAASSFGCCILECPHFLLCPLVQLFQFQGLGDCPTAKVEQTLTSRLPLVSPEPVPNPPTCFKIRITFLYLSAISHISALFA